MRRLPLLGVKVLELEGLAIAPHAGMVLSDFGADVVRVDRKGREPHYGTTALGRGKRRLPLDLKDVDDHATFRALAMKADVLIEPYRPGVMEALRLGPLDLCGDEEDGDGEGDDDDDDDDEEGEAINRRLLYVRMTGWGQSGPRSRLAGHDINYIAQAGVLNMIRDPQSDTPVPPVNFLGDFAGGSVSAVMGIALALLEREKSGRGQVIDANVTEGAAYLSSFIWKLASLPGGWQDPPGSNMLDGAAPFYGVYKTLDERHMAVGAIEPAFWSELLEKLGLDAAEVPAQSDRTKWPELRSLMRDVFAKHTQAHWTRVFEGSDACVSPILDREQCMSDRHNVARGMFTEDGMPTPAPILCSTPGRPGYAGKSGDGELLASVENVRW